MWARLASSLGLILAFAAPVADLLGMDRMDALDQPAIQILGAVIAVAGIVGAMVSQAAMGDAWRPDVTPGDRTVLVTDGPFRLVRNPVLACTAATVIGIALLVPNVLALAMLACFLLGIQIQVHVVEEPHLLGVHGDAYRRYAARTGRYLPFMGRLRPPQ